MEKLLEVIRDIKQSKTKELIDMRLKEFEAVGKRPSQEIFKELCFCILTANFNAERAIKIQEEIGDEFLTLPEFKMARKLRELGHRFPDKRARYIVEARKYKDSLKDIIKSLKENELRDWLDKNIDGLGYKEASHFLRNIGYKDFAIIDFHIIDILLKYKLIEKPKTLTKKKYLEIESLLKRIAEQSDLNLAEIDLYLWYAETGKILK